MKTTIAVSLAVAVIVLYAFWPKVTLGDGITVMVSTTTLERNRIIRWCLDRIDPEARELCIPVKKKNKAPH